MANYEKFTVVQLRAELKNRGIVHKLTRKQQLVDRLAEHDSEQTVQGQHSALEGEAPQEAHESSGPEAPDATSHESASLRDQPAGVVSTGQESSGRVEYQAGVGGEDPEIEEASQVDGPSEAPTQLDEKNEHHHAAVETPGSTAVSEQVAHDTSDTGSIPPEEIRKRKRRSASPQISVQEVASKRFKPEDDAPKVHLKEDLVDDEAANIGHQTFASTTVGDSQRTTGQDLDDTVRPAVERRDHTTYEASRAPDTIVPESGAPDDNASTKARRSSPRPSTVPAQQSEDVANAADRSSPAQTPPNPPAKHQAGIENLYKGLIRSPSATKVKDFPGHVVSYPEAYEDQDISPALHPATTALYIRNLMRPLQPNQLKEHITMLARPPGTAGEPTDAPDGVVVNFHLDSIRTHCFVVFSSVSAASRVRNALHNRIWPPERLRKPLWVDFVPEDKVRSWAETEQEGTEGRRGSSTRRWEVVYEALDDGTMSTRLEETGAPSNQQRQAAAGNPTQRVTERPLPQPEVQRESSTGRDKTELEPAGFVALDSLFKFTMSKPKLYYLPMDKDQVARRLDELDAKSSRRNAIPPGGSGYRDSRRYTFEEGDVLVDNGPEFGLRSERGGRGGYRPPQRGGWAGR